MKSIRVFSIIALWMAAHGSIAQSFKPSANSEKVLGELRKTSQATTSIQASFTEEKYLAVLKEPEKSSGLFYYQQKDKMRWEQRTPSKYIILINGEKLRVQEGNKEKNVGQAGRMAAQIKELMIGLVNGDFQQNKGFSSAVLEDSDEYQIVLTPVNRRLKNIYSKITMNFSRSSLRLKELSFFEKGGDKSIMKFQQEKFNQPIAENLFQDL
ncbi:outer membrane lipoprotein-sorting protein [Dyadobacter sp. BE34]|uniref:Outer membrane lipoprotein-sorting protein n=1 Tax=Dyadobacter fermentans TaxID=94254 RepID=A0ABU1R5U5_9BACT|nr:MULTISPECIES: outer membrane lipoprotein carrier protein LolA [Dyadobacter]MDR6808773.1 outer membrane lipoprotein-sorting protein [Dyadobacter fermentans]MDR7046516.1 outer membrane lipoprotein-sorting protein [Dyadobacter sp. BE242]MDR7200829.1 outer membrane lipoprotein-sorting protein [Dyadobacter sp. BE34]MDR7218789.1 outer membrane lipoprotein-sorting protein [Dyadobacter sp. BE31]MDR7266719.1 outer membrane lipoprotein-sorting protein [Dyadobacter sp. BE32]